MADFELGDRVVVWAKVEPVVVRQMRKWERTLIDPVEGIVTGLRFKKEGALIDMPVGDSIWSLEGTYTEFRESRTVPVVLVTFDIYRNPLVCLLDDVDFVMVQ